MQKRSFWNTKTLQKATNTITPGTMMLRIAAVLMALVALAIAQDNEQTCLADGTQCSCRDEHESCDYWQSLGEWYEFVWRRSDFSYLL